MTSPWWPGCWVSSVRPVHNSQYQVKVTFSALWVECVLPPVPLHLPVLLWFLHHGALVYRWLLSTSAAIYSPPGMWGGISLLPPSLGRGTALSPGLLLLIARSSDVGKHLWYSAPCNWHLSTVPSLGWLVLLSIPWGLQGPPASPDLPDIRWLSGAWHAVQPCLFVYGCFSTFAAWPARHRCRLNRLLCCLLFRKKNNFSYCFDERKGWLMVWLTLI